MTGPGFTHLAEVGSTNDWLLERADGLPDGQWVIADRQTAGRGRRGRVWSDGAGNLMASVLVRAQGPVQQLSFVAALALREAIVGAKINAPLPLAGEGTRPLRRAGEGVLLRRDEGTPSPGALARVSPLPQSGVEGRLRLKWPNDLLLDGTKVSGILLERAGTALVIGLGLNLVSHPEATERPATSLAAAGIAPPLPVAVLERLMPAFAAYRDLWAAQGFEPIRSRWLAHAAGIGDRIAARLGDESLEGVFEGLDADGALALRLDDGRRRAIHAGEVFAL